MKRVLVLVVVAGCGGARAKPAPAPAPSPFPLASPAPRSVTITLRAEPPSIPVGAYTQLFWTLENHGTTPLTLLDSGEVFTATIFGPDGKEVPGWVPSPDGNRCADSADLKEDPPRAPLPPITVAPGAKYVRDLWWTALSYGLGKVDICGSRFAQEQGKLPPGSYRVRVEPPLALQVGTLPPAVIVITVK
ncbi:MAG: hypothetical protein IT370_28425 [Deltaproteobacteria bacterium]|nr:hypothetical protein [Deltaproteobacteria bacterium]